MNVRSRSRSSRVSSDHVAFHHPITSNYVMKRGFLSTESKRRWREINPDRSRTYERERAFRRRADLLNSYWEYERSVKRFQARLRCNRWKGAAEWEEYCNSPLFVRITFPPFAESEEQ
jgi:hypothetical protein